MWRSIFTSLSLKDVEDVVDIDVEDVGDALEDVVDTLEDVANTLKDVADTDVEDLTDTL